MSFSQIKFFFVALALAMLAGCIADRAEDTRLPWSSNKSWEGLVPIAPSVMDRYE
jgi:hypothetical protein